MVLLGGVGGSPAPKKKKPKKSPSTGVGGPSGLNPFAGGHPSQNKRPDPVPQGSKPNLISSLVQPKINVPLSDPNKFMGQDRDPSMTIAEFMKNARLNSNGTPYAPYDDNLVSRLKDAKAQVDDPRAPRATPREIQELLLNPLNPALMGRFQPNVSKATRKASPRDWNDQQVMATLMETGNQPGTSYFQNDVNSVLESRLYQQQEELKNRNFDRGNEIKEVLDAAKQAAFDGDYDYLKNYMKDNPEFSLDMPTYRSEFGIGPRMLKKQWEKIKPYLSDEDIKYWAGGRNGRFEDLVGHYSNLKASYAKSNKFVQDRIRDYESSYAKSVEFGRNAKGEGADERIKKALAAGPAIPTNDPGGVSKEDQELMDKVGSKLNRSTDKKYLKEVREGLMEKLGVSKLPSLEQMLTVKVQQGELDPNDQEQLTKWSDRLSNPDHPDTLAMYYRWGLMKNPELSQKDDDISKFINSPIEAYNNVLQAEAETKARKEYEADIADMDEVTGVGDFFDDMWSNATQTTFDGLSPAVGPGGRPAGFNIDSRVLEQNETAMHNPLLWTFDKISRPIYTIAGTWDALYGLDQDDEPWYGDHGESGDFLARAAMFPVDPLAVVTGKSVWDSADELVTDPGGSTKKLSGAAYNQFLRGSGAPGINPETTPTLFSQVIANANENDPFKDVYDDKHYQHIAGFGMDLLGDPLNLVGLGIVSDVLKMPAQFVKQMGKADAGAVGRYSATEALRSLNVGVPGRVADIDEAITGLNTLDGARHTETTSMFPFYVDRANRTDMRFSVPKGTTADDFGYSGFYGMSSDIEKSYARDQASNAGMWDDALGTDYPEYSYLDVPSATKLVEDVRVKKQINADMAGVEYLQAEMSRIGEQLNLTDVIPDLDLRGHRIGAVTQGKVGDKTVKGDVLYAPGGKLATDMKALDEVAHGMGFTREGRNGLEGDSAAWLAAGAPTDVESLTAAYKVGRTPKEINTIKQQLTQAQNFKEKYYNVFARSAAGRGVPAETFKKVYSADDVMRALVEGPQMYMANSELARATMTDAMMRMETTARKIAGYKTNRNLTAQQRQALIRDNLQARQIAITNASKVRIDGALQYLDALAHLRANGELWKVPAQAEKLTAKRQRLVNLEESLKNQTVTYKDSAHLLPKTGGASERPMLDSVDNVGDYVGSESSGIGALDDRAFVDADLDRSVPDLLRSYGPSFSNRELALKALGSETRRQIKALDKEIASLRLDKDGVITGLPPRQATKVERMLPPNSMFRGKDGLLDVEKIMNVFEIGDWANRQTRHAVSYRMPEGATPQDTAFIGLVRDTIEAEYRDAYKLIQNRKQEEIAALTEPEVPVGSTAPESNFDQIPVDRTDDIGPRPTRDSLTEEYYQTHSRPEPIKHPESESIPQMDRPSADSLRYRYFDDNKTEIEAWAKRQVMIWKDKAAKFQRIIDTHDVNITEASRRKAARDLQALGKKPTVEGMKMKYAQNEANKMKIDAYIKEHQSKHDQRFTSETVKPTPKVAKDPGLEHFIETRQKIWDKKNAGRFIGEGSKKIGHRVNEGDILKNFPERPTSKTVAALYPKQFKQINDVAHGNDLPTSEAGPRMGPGEKRLTEELDFDADQITGLGISKEWDKFVERFQRNWDKADNIRKSKAPVETPNLKHTPDFDYHAVRDEAFDLARKSTIESIAKMGEIQARPGNFRANISESINNSVRKGKLALRQQELELRIARTEAQAAGDVSEAARLTLKLKGLDKQRQEFFRETKKAAYQARATAREVRARYGEEEIIQLIQAPEKMTGRQLQVRLLGMQKNLQFPVGLYRGAEAAERLVPANAMNNFMNTFVDPAIRTSNVTEAYRGMRTLSGTAKAKERSWSLSDQAVKTRDYFTRPSKQLQSIEAIRIRAQITGVTPTIIKAHLTRLDHRMGDIRTAERRNMMQSYRDGIEYDGPNASLYGPLKDELDEIADIWNGTNKLYETRSPFPDIRNTSNITWDEIIRYLPDEYRPNMKLLKKFAMMGKDKGRVNIDDIMRAIEGNPHPTPKDFTDPARFAHVMRIATDEAMQLRAVKRSIQKTFGIERRNVDPKTGNVLRHDDKSRLIEKLHTDYGWETVPWLGKDHYFPPQASKDISKLKEFTEPTAEMSTLFDKALGYWKSGVTIYNPGYYSRNGIGEIMASWLDGVNHPKWYRYANDVRKWKNAADGEMAEMLEKWASLEGVDIPLEMVSNTKELFRLRGGLKVTVEDAWREYNMLGLKSTFANTDLEQGVRSLGGARNAKTKTGAFIKARNENIHNVGEGFEDYLRMAHFLHAMQHSGKTTMREAANYAAERVTKYHFDYSDFSKFEKSVMLRVFPFYKWTRRGAPLMFQHLFLTPGKMTAIPKTMNFMSNMGFDPMGVVTDDPVFSTKDVHEDKNGFLPDYDGWAPQWVKDLFAYQMQPAADDEYAHYFRVQTPQIDGLNILSQIADNPTNPMEWDSALALLNPAIKAPIELARNKRLDPDSDFEIYGGQYNENAGLNNGEAVGAYLAQQANPWGGFLGKLSKNGDLGPLSIGAAKEGDEDYQTIRDIASHASGLGFYQGKDQKPPKDEVKPPAPVGYSDLLGVPGFSDRKVASGVQDTDKNIESLLKGGGLFSSTDGQVTAEGNDNLGYGGYRNYRNYYHSGGYGGSGGGSNFFNLIKFLQELASQTDPGQVYKGWKE